MPTLDETECRRRFGREPRAVLASHGPRGRIDQVPITFAVTGDTLVTAVDHKPKQTPRLRRLDNIRADPVVSLLVDHYAEDWDELWWVRVHGMATVHGGGVDDPEAARTFSQLCRRYRAYADRSPTGSIIVVRLTRWVGWASVAP